MRKLLLVFVILTIGITGCGKQEEELTKIGTHIEQSILLEGNESDGKKLTELENQEEAIYKKIVALMGEGKKKEIKEEAQKALQIVKQRQVYVADKKNKMADSLKEINKANEVILTLRNEKFKKSGESVVEVAKERIKNSEKMFELYKVALKHDETLYTLFVNGDFSNDKITKEVNALNSNYSEVLILNEEISKQTEIFNKKKESFFTETGYVSKDKKE